MTQSLLFDTLISLKSLGHSPAQIFYFFFLGFKSCVWVVTHRIYIYIYIYGSTKSTHDLKVPGDIFFLTVHRTYPSVAWPVILIIRRHNSFDAELRLQACAAAHMHATAHSPQFTAVVRTAPCAFVTLPIPRSRPVSTFCPMRFWCGLTGCFGLPHPAVFAPCGRQCRLDRLIPSSDSSRSSRRTRTRTRWGSRSDLTGMTRERRLCFHRSWRQNGG